MYILATTTKYEKGTKYYTKSGETYTLLVEGTDYDIGDTITGTIYEGVKYDRMYFRPWGSTGTYKTFPYKVDNVATIPENDASANDVDLDAYTNTAGKTIRNRVRHDVASIEFNVPTMNGWELHNLFDETTSAWLDAYFFYEPSWGFVSKKVYRSATVKYHRYFIDEQDPDKNIYQNVAFSFVEE